MTLSRSPAPQGYMLFGPAPKFPDVPHAEWKARIDKAKRLMKEQDIDLLMLWSRQNCRYFTGFTSIHWHVPSIQPLVALIPADGDPVVITGDFFRLTVEAQSWVRDIRGQTDCHTTQGERAFPKEVAATAKEMGCGKANIALEMGELGHMWIPRPLNDIQTLMKELPEASFVDGDKVIWGCRMVKSPLEIERLTKAAAVHRQGVATVIEEYRPGMTEQDVGKILWKSWGQNGSDWMLSGHIMCGSDKEGILDTGFHFDGVTINQGDYLSLDMCMRYQGYWADMGRVINVGPPPDHFEKATDTLWRVWEAGFEAAKPGARARDIWLATEKAYSEAGLPAIEMTGHGIGMDIHEPPVLSATEETVLEPGMTFELETGILSGFRSLGGEGAGHVENLVIITETGARSVMGLPKSIRCTRFPT